ncbi:unnamed protein product [Malus baccata var. baccata]
MHSIYVFADCLCVCVCVVALRRLGVKGVEIRKPEQLESVASLIIPGGESTTMAKLAEYHNLFPALREFVKMGKPVWGTCAGLIFLANKATGQKIGGQELVGGLDCTVHRNFFGSQIQSFEAELAVPELASTEGGPEVFRGVFIRAPAILDVGPEVEVLADYPVPSNKVLDSNSTVEVQEENPVSENKVIVAVRQKNLLATAFHPELTADTRWHSYFLKMSTETGEGASSSIVASALCFLLILLSSTFFVTSRAVQPYEQANQLKPPGINAGYHAMTLTLDTILEAVILPTLNINPNTTLTLFCPRDQAFFNPKYPQPLLTLLEYHVVPFKMDKDAREASLRHGSKVDTLLLGHPLVVTSLPVGTSGYASLNQVKVIEWDVYNDGRLIVHGVEDFFDPAFQTLRYQEYDVTNVREDSSHGFFAWPVAAGIISWFLFLALLAGFTSRSRICCSKPYNVGEYEPLPFITMI